MRSGSILKTGRLTGGTPICNIPDAADRIWAAREAARAAAIPIVINARTDLYLRNPRRRRLRVTPRISRAKPRPCRGALSSLRSWHAARRHSVKPDFSLGEVVFVDLLDLVSLRDADPYLLLDHEPGKLHAVDEDDAF